MHDRLRFGLAALAISIALFVGLAWLNDRGVAGLEPLGFLVPVVAVMLSARGATLSRRLAWSGGSVLLLAVVVAGAQVLGIAPTRSSNPEYQASIVRSLGTGLYSWVVLIYPLVVLVLFTGRRPSMLWSQAAPPKPRPRG
jgi:hypothetical protein